MTFQSDSVALLAVAVLMVSGLGLMVLRLRENKAVKANVTIVIPRAAEVTAVAVLQRLLSVRGTRLEGLTPYRSVLVMTRTPSWAILPALWLFPVGVFFLLMKDEVRLEVSMYASQAGTVVRLVGPTETALLRKAVASLTSLPGAREGVERQPMLSHDY